MATNAELVGIMEGAWRSFGPVRESLGDGEWSLDTGCPGWSVKLGARLLGVLIVTP